MTSDNGPGPRPAHIYTGTWYKYYDSGNPVGWEWKADPGQGFVLDYDTLTVGQVTSDRRQEGHGHLSAWEQEFQP